MKTMKRISRRFLEHEEVAADLWDAFEIVAYWRDKANQSRAELFDHMILIGDGYILVRLIVKSVNDVRI